MTPITMETRVARSSDLLATELDGETVLMSIQQGSYYGLENTARRIWELVEQPRSVTDLCRQLAEEYEVQPDVCQHDVLLFLTDLLKEGIIVVA